MQPVKIKIMPEIMIAQIYYHGACRFAISGGGIWLGDGRAAHGQTDRSASASISHAILLSFCFKFGFGYLPVFHQSLQPLMQTIESGSRSPNFMCKWKEKM
jgi:hypothetical protein